MNKRIAQALVEDIQRKRTGGDTIEFKDDNNIYTVTVTVKQPGSKVLYESRAAAISSAPSGNACTCCGGSGRS